MAIDVRRIAVIGAGYVGLTTAACMASLGHCVRCADRDVNVIRRLRNGQVHILEPGLQNLVREGLTAGRLRFDIGAYDAVADAEIVFLCLPTPTTSGGAPDITAIRSVVMEIANILPEGSAVVVKSTVPPGTAAQIAYLLSRPDIAVASNPEFLREGRAVADFLRPDRIVVGSDTDDTGKRIADLYLELGVPVVLTSTASAELAKYAANCFLAVKLSFINDVADLCERTGADVADVVQVLGYDPRIGASHLQPGPGWGGPCLPKDVHALLHVADAAGMDFGLLRAGLIDNKRQQRRIVGKVRSALGGSLLDARIALLGLAFKVDTSDLRDSPAIAVGGLLTAEQAQVTGYDPAVRGSVAGISVAEDPYQAVTGAAAAVLLTDWPQFRMLDWTRVSQLMTGNTVIDTRNYLDPSALKDAGLCWQGVGMRSSV